MAGLQQTYNATPPVSNRADFHRPDFELLIQQKGRNVIVEQAVECSCKGKESNQQSNCRNCGGTGWIFLNPRETRLILKAMKVTQDYAGWSQEIKGDIEVTGSNCEELTAMDRITIKDAIAIFTEALFFKVRSGTTFAYTKYNIKEIKYIAYFKGTDEPLQRLQENVDYTFENNIIKLINSDLTPVQGQISVSIRYTHAPQYHMIDMRRESMESFEMVETEKLIHLPIYGIARRAHYILDANNITGDRLINNSYVQ